MGKEWTKPMQWDNEGTPPSESLVKSGFQAYYKPPANIFNYFLHRFKACIEELQTEADTINITKATKEELANAANSKAPTNHAAAATTYGVATESFYGHVKASSTAPKANGTAAAGSETASFARGDHVHPMQEAGVGITTGGTGAAYTATVVGIATLKAGANFTMVPHAVSTSKTPTLNVNGLGAKQIRRRLSGSTTATTPGGSESWLAASKPVRVFYDGTYWIVDLPVPNASDVYGELPVSKGGTGCKTVTAGSFLVGDGTDKLVEKTPEQVRGILGGAELLWTNSDYTSAFEAQTITLDVSKYTLLLIEFNMSTVTTSRFTGIVVASSRNEQYVSGRGRDSVNEFARAVTVESSNQISFSRGYIYGFASGSLTRNFSDYDAIPYRIYGIR